MRRVIAPEEATSQTAAARSVDPIAGTKQERRRAQYELLRTLIHRELRGRYRDSMLGSAWTLLQPLLMTGIYYFIFAFLFNTSTIPNYALFVLVGIIIWNFFATVIPQGTGSLTGNSDIIRKVWFRRELIPMAVVIGASASTGILLILVIPLCVFANHDVLKTFWIAPIFFVLLVTMAFGLSALFAVINVFFRDVAHLVGVVLLPLFFLTPVFYSFDALPVTPPEWVVLVMRYANPLTPYLETLRALLLEGQLPGWPLIAYCVVVGPTLAVAGVWFLRRFDERLAVNL